MIVYMKKVLIISYYWPPSGGAGVQRWLKFAKYLPSFGWQPHVYTPENPEAPAQDNSLLKDIPQEVVVVKQPIFEPYGFYKKFTGNKKNVNAGFLSENKDSRKKFTEQLSIWVRGNMFIPDARKFWIKPSIKFLKEYIEKEGIEIIISTGPPHSMHLIALGLKKQLNIKWIADFRDPWTNIDFYKDLMLTKAADKKHHRLEKEVLQTADEVVTIGKTMAKEFENIRNSEVRVITNGYDADDFEWKEKTESDKFIIVHVGSINADRNHKIFWQALKEICDENQDFNKYLQLRFIGKLDYSVIESVEQFNLKDQFEQVEYVSHDKVKDYLFESDVLYLPLNNTPNAKGILSGKFFEYLAVGKSILGIGHPQGDAAEIMTEVKAGSMIDFDNYQGVKDFLLQEFSKRNEVKSIDLENRKGYSRKSLTADLVSLF
jgi:glycosyltransferase involved in cell wall biosynthesis